MNRDFDAVHMRRALELARRGRGTTWPNPMVGAVVVRDGRVVGEGYHRVAGGPHAEVEALQAVDGDPAGATLVVNLEPCSHHARTGPCAELVAHAHLRRVVIGTLDPNPEVRGRGATVLRDAGVQVAVGSLPELRIPSQEFKGRAACPEEHLAVPCGVRPPHRGKFACMVAKQRCIASHGAILLGNGESLFLSRHQ